MGFQELIPELFYLPEIFRNSNDFPLGRRADSTKLGERFVHLKNLELYFVSAAQITKKISMGVMKRTFQLLCFLM